MNKDKLIKILVVFILFALTIIGLYIAQLYKMNFIWIHTIMLYSSVPTTILKFIIKLFIWLMIMFNKHFICFKLYQLAYHIILSYIYAKLIFS